jgi:hypothetical protein
MRAISRVAAIAVILTGSIWCSGTMARAQAPAAGDKLVGSPETGSAGAPTGAPTGTATGAPKSSETAKAAAVPPGDLRKLTERQKALASQADRLVNMANELKEQVDKTDKNILSLKVVEKAQEIEALAKGMKEQARKAQ